MGRGYRQLPPLLSRKRCIVNVQNQDNRCFGYAVIGALENITKNANQPVKYVNLFPLYGLDALQYPVDVEDIAAIEDRLQLNFNVFSFYDDDGRLRYPLYVSMKKHARTIDLIYWDGHYAWIKSFSSFMADLVKTQPLYWCRACLKHFSSERILARHNLKCGGVLRIGQTIMKPKKFINDLAPITKVLID